MTTFLCILALLALWSSPGIKGKPEGVAEITLVIALYLGWVLLVLALVAAAAVVHLW